MNPEEIHRKANQMLEGFSYFVCENLNARMAIRTCLEQQRDKNCANAYNCNQGASLAKKNPELKKEVLNKPPKEIKSKLGFKTSENKNPKNPEKQKEPRELKPHCSYKDCTEPYIARKLCKKHYGLWRNGTLTDYPAYIRKSAIPEEPEMEEKEKKIIDPTSKKLKEDEDPITSPIPKEFEVKKQREISLELISESEKESEALSVDEIRDTKLDSDIPGLLELDLSPYEGLFEKLEAKAIRKIRTPKQQAIYYIKRALEDN